MIRQLHYTSCRHGRDGIQGFQVAAATPGVPSRYEDLGLPLAAYRPPPSTPAAPSPAAIAALPVAFGFRDFGEVGVLFRSHYLGEDFSGRQGNYFAHLVLLDRPGDDLAGLVPAAMWNAAFWARGPFRDGGDTALPALDELPVAGSPGDGVAGWIDRYRADFAALLAAVRGALAGRLRRVVVVVEGADPGAQVAAAVLAVTASLPGRLARAVSFTTFCATPDDIDVLVVGTTPDAAPRSGRRDRAALRLGASAPGSPPSAYEALVAARWQAGPDSVATLHRLAAQISPALTADELDAFAMAVPLLDDGGARSPDPLPGLEFLVDRHPRALTPSVWERVEAAVAAGTAPMDDLGRWSAVLSRTSGARPVLESTYLRGVLTRLAAVGEATEFWFPAIDAGFGDGTAAWAVAAVAADPRPEVALRVLRTLAQLRVAPPDADLEEISDLALLPLVLDPDGDVGPFRELPDAPRLGRIMAAQLEDRLDDDLVATVTEGLTVEAAEWLRDAAAPGGRVALVVALRLAAAGRRDPVEVVVRHVTDPAGLDRLVGLVWPVDPPTAAQGIRLLTDLDPGLVAASAVPARLATRLVIDAPDQTVPEVEELARGLAALPPEAPDDARAHAEAVLATAWFRGNPATAPGSLDQFRAAALAGPRIPAELGRPLVRALVHRLFECDAVLHAEMLEILLSGGMPHVVPVYSERLERTMEAADLDGILAVLPAVAHLSVRWPDIDRVLAGPCAAALGRRRRKLLDELGYRLSTPGSVPVGLHAGRAVTWTAWWKTYHTNHVAPSSSGLRDRLLRFGRGG